MTAYTGKIFVKPLHDIPDTRFIEKIIIDSPDPTLASVVQDNFPLILRNLDRITHPVELCNLLRNFSESLAIQLPFLIFENVYIYRNQINGQTYPKVWRQYARAILNPVPLSTMRAERIIACTAQALTIEESLPDQGWRVYHPLMVDGSDASQKRLSHLVVARRINGYYLLVDPTHGPFSGPFLSGGGYYVRPVSEFESSFREATIVDNFDK